MKIGIIIPTRGDRPWLFENCMRLIRAQTLQPAIIEVVDDVPLSEKCDITWRYRTGYDRLRNKDLDIIALMEDDDWYHPQYLEFMANQWVNFQRPDIIGQNRTIYYNIRLAAYFTMFHESRSLAMNTLLRPDMDFKWPKDDDPYTDSWLWSVIRNRVIIQGNTPICMGIKHGIGLTGGHYHSDKTERYINKDPSGSFLQKMVDPESFQFYSSFKNKAV